MSSDESQTRTRILNATWRLLESGGGSRVRLSDIAKEAGISRQAVYLHFPTRAELLVATTRHLDAHYDIDGRLAASRAAQTGIERLETFITAWLDYIPRIYGVGKALMAMMDSDREAEQAWMNRMAALRQGCEAAVQALHRDGVLVDALTVDRATDLLWALLSVRNWELLTIRQGWAQSDYVATIREAAIRMLVRKTG
jgi:AcrR family transcriptional regulator